MRTSTIKAAVKALAKRRLSVLVCMLLFGGSGALILNATSDSAAHNKTALETRYTPQVVITPAELKRPATETRNTLIRNEQTVDFIVRFEEGIEAVDACLEVPRDNLQEAKLIFADWAATEEALKGLSLKKISLSGELILTWNSGIHRPLLRTEVNERLKQLSAMPGVKYADPDYTVQNGAGIK